MIRVLSVEDEPDLQRLRALALVDEDLEVHLAFNGPQGFEKAVALRPHVILVDLMMPGYDGRELIRRLRLDPATRETPLVVITAYSASETYGESAISKLGVDAYLPKPTPREDLVAVIRSLGGRRAALTPRPRLP